MGIHRGKHPGNNQERIMFPESSKKIISGELFIILHLLWFVAPSFCFASTSIVAVYNPFSSSLTLPRLLMTQLPCNFTICPSMLSCTALIYPYIYILIYIYTIYIYYIYIYYIYILYIYILYIYILYI